jgi:hypothetical protein
MIKPLTVLCGTVGLAVAAIIAIPTAQVEAKCEHCNRAVASTKVSTTYKYKTVQRVKNVTQYKDVNRTKYTKHINRVVTVTRVQPVTRLSVVTRVHNRTVVLRQTQHVAQARTLPTRTIKTAKTIQVNHMPTSVTCGQCK